jgi:hypothetical protein
MQVSFEHKEGSRGIFKKTTHIEVLTTVRFSDDELAIIANRKLKDFTVWDRTPDFVSSSYSADQLKGMVEVGFFRLTVAKLLKKPDSYTCASVVHANNYEEEMTAKLKQLKEFIAGNSAIAKPKTIEL